MDYEQMGLLKTMGLFMTSRMPFMLKWLISGGQKYALTFILSLSS